MDLTSFTSFDLSLAQGWLTVAFNEPQRKNPLTMERVADLQSLCTQLQDNRAIRGVIFRGQGGVFCAGGDIKAFQQAFAGGDVRDDVIALSQDAAAIFDAIDQLPQFTVMVVEGAAMAGGMGLACCGDYVIADHQAKFALSETRLGLVAAQIAPLVIRRVGKQMARGLMLRAGSLAGQAAMDAGLVDILTTNETQIEQALSALRSDIQKTGPNALAVTKALVAEIDHLPRTDQITRAATDFADCLLSEEGKEGVMSFMQKKKPSWAEVSDV